MTDTNRQQKFGTTDHSATAPFLKKLVSERVIEHLPAFYSPNALTLTGGVFATSSILIIWLFADTMQSGSLAGKVLMMSSAVLLIIYAVFDQLDGMQARKLGRSSPFGDFLDHWVDTIIANSATVPIMVLLGLPHWMLWLMAFVTALAFWAHNWETRNRNYRDLPVVGGLESIWTALAIMSITAVVGIEIWHYNLVGVTMAQVFYWLGLSALLWVVIKALNGSQIRLGDYAGFCLSLLPVSVWLLAAVSLEAIAAPFVWFGYVTLGFLATWQTGNLMRHLWLNAPYQMFDITGFVFGCALIAALYADQQGLTSAAQQGLISLILIIAIVRVAWQGIRSYRQMDTQGQ